MTEGSVFFVHLSSNKNSSFKEESSLVARNDLSKCKPFDFFSGEEKTKYSFYGAKLVCSGIYFRKNIVSEDRKPDFKIIALS